MADANVTVYTTIIGGFDNLRRPREINPNVRYICYSDEPLPKVEPWEVLPAFQPYWNDPARCVRVHKMLSHHFTDTEYSIWIDANFELGLDPVRLVNGYLRDTGNDIAVFSHHGRQCLFDEGEHCADMNFDDPETIRNQMKRYRDDGYTRGRGLYACGVILRKHTDLIKRFNEYWWVEVINYSKRDQISFPYIAWKAGVKIGVIPGTIVSSNEFIYRHHGPWRSHSDNTAYLAQMAAADRRRELLWSLCPRTGNTRWKRAPR